MGNDKNDRQKGVLKKHKLVWNKVERTNNIRDVAHA